MPGVPRGCACGDHHQACQPVAVQFSEPLLLSSPVLLLAGVHGLSHISACLYFSDPFKNLHCLPREVNAGVNNRL